MCQLIKCTFDINNKHLIKCKYVENLKKRIMKNLLYFIFIEIKPPLGFLLYNGKTRFLYQSLTLLKYNSCESLNTNNNYFTF